MIPVPGPWQESNIIKLRGEVSNVFEVLRGIGATGYMRYQRVLVDVTKCS